MRSRFDDVALFVSSPGGALFDAIEAPAALSGLPIVRATRTIDEKVLRSREFGFRNGHVPVTGILSAVAVLAAVSTGRDAVVMSNERSASEPTLVLADRSINHQYSKSWSFEQALRAVLAETLGPQLGYFSLLRPYSELWVAERFAKLRDYHHVFRSCNRAFHIDPAARLDHWCGHCDKCASSTSCSRRSSPRTSSAASSAVRNRCATRSSPTSSALCSACCRIANPSNASATSTNAGPRWR